MPIQNHYLQTAGELVDRYDGTIPLHSFLKQFFSQHKKYGSRDRKNISSLCYNFFRLGKALAASGVENKLVLSLFLASREPNNLLHVLSADFNENTNLTLEEKLAFAGVKMSAEDIFPLQHELSDGIDIETYTANFIVQQDIFIRIRPGKASVVLKKLDDLKWKYVAEGSSAIRLEPGMSLQQYFEINGELVIQDLNSQEVGRIIQEIFYQQKYLPKQVWDCCAASGGKSIMLADLFPSLSIIASDIRQSILYNLAKRFNEAGIRNYQSFVTDLAVQNPTLPIKPQHFIMADVPCTGSGTWARTPEQLYFFNYKKIEEYAAKQYTIANNAIRFLVQGGWLIYVTCSVFKQENELIVQKLVKINAIKLIHQQLLNGTKQKSDSMFVAILQKQVA